jgi:hypothetical protein
MASKGHAQLGVGVCSWQGVTIGSRGMQKCVGVVRDDEQPLIDQAARSAISTTRWNRGARRRLR